MLAGFLAGSYDCAMSHPPMSREESRKVILGILQSAPHLTFPQILERFGRSDSYTRLLLGELEAQGDVEKTVGKRPVYWRATRHA